MTKRKSTQADMPALPIAIEQATPAKPKAPKAQIKAQAEALAQAEAKAQADRDLALKQAAEVAAQEFTRAKAGEGERAIYKGAETRGENAMCQLAPVASWDNPRAQAIKYAGFMCVAGKIPAEWLSVKAMGAVYVSLGKFSTQHSFEQGLNRLLRGHAMERNAMGLVRIHPYAIERAMEDTQAGLNPYHKA